jgi:hypothetical protein
MFGTQPADGSGCGRSRESPASGHPLTVVRHGARRAPVTKKEQQHPLSQNCQGRHARSSSPCLGSSAGIPDCHPDRARLLLFVIPSEAAAGRRRGICVAVSSVSFVNALSAEVMNSSSIESEEEYLQGVTGWEHPPLPETELFAESPGHPRAG